MGYAQNICIPKLEEYMHCRYTKVIRNWPL